VVTGDIGCYTLGALKPLGALHTTLCMGASITMFEGFYRALGKGVAAVIGDSTFVHSGIPGLINAAYNGAKGLILILDNGTTAMTGSQPNPATGVDAKGNKVKQLVLEDICKAAGADSVCVVNPFQTDVFEKTVKEALEREALSVVIARYPCRIIHRAKEKPAFVVKEKCKKCGVCLTIDCPALVKHDDGLVSVDSGLCTGCYLCVKTCKFNAIETSK
jgi:indolepyruvate ferredoxin oxidoreductase alpha subunit